MEESCIASTSRTFRGRAAFYGEQTRKTRGRSNSSFESVCYTRYFISVLSSRRLVNPVTVRGVSDFCSCFCLCLRLRLSLFLFFVLCVDVCYLDLVSSQARTSQSQSHSQSRLQSQSQSDLESESGSESGYDLNSCEASG